MSIEISKETIKNELISGKSVYFLAKKYGMSATHMHRILKKMKDMNIKISVDRNKSKYRFDYQHHYFEVMADTLENAIGFMMYEMSENGLDNWVSY